MKKRLSTADYDFFEADGNLIVEFLNKPELPDADLSMINTAVVGIMRDDSKWTVTIISKESIQKLQLSITNSLEVVGFSFDTFEEALDVQKFIIYYLL